MSRAAAEIEPVSRILSSSLALPGPIRAPDSKTMLTRTRAMPHCDMHSGGFRGARQPAERGRVTVTPAHAFLAPVKSKVKGLKLP
jgi:hypothetical protein